MKNKIFFKINIKIKEACDHIVDATKEYAQKLLSTSKISKRLSQWNDKFTYEELCLYFSVVLMVQTMQIPNMHL